MIIIVKPVAQVTHSGLEATGAQVSFHHFSGFQPIIYKLHLHQKLHQRQLGETDP